MVCLGGLRGRLTVPHGVGHGVILEVAADGGQILLDLDAGGLEDGLRADAAELEDLGRVDGTGGEDDFLLRVNGGDGAVGQAGDLNTLGS